MQQFYIVSTSQILVAFMRAKYGTSILNIGRDIKHDDIHFIWGFKCYTIHNYTEN